MLFNSYSFVLIFLPICLAGFYLLRFFVKRDHGFSMCKIWLCALSLIFYYSFGFSFFALFILDIILNHFLALLIVRKRTGKILFLAVLTNILLLAFFKYFGLFTDMINGIMGSSFDVSQILLPLAISFYTFEQISYLTDLYKGEIKEHKFIDYLTFITFFPKLLEGPIIRFGEFQRQLQRATKEPANAEQIYRGMTLFILGLFKKAILADYIGTIVDYGYPSISSLSFMEALIVIVCYSFQIYFDFSGYCDMGRGIANMLGFDLVANFDMPYKAVNIVDFWKRWHITLTAFFTKYVYIPLGGSRKGKARTYMNMLFIFLLSGFWHGAGATFVIWGLLHGVLYCVTKLYLDRKKTIQMRNTASRAESFFAKKIRKGLSILLTFSYVTFAWVFFRASSIGDAALMLGRIFTKPSLQVSRAFAELFEFDEIWYVFKVTPLSHMAAGVYVCMLLILLICFAFIWVFRKDAYRLALLGKISVIRSLLLAVIFVWCLLTFSNVSTFIYLNF